jgi:hypothetical protein
MICRYYGKFKLILRFAQDDNFFAQDDNFFAQDDGMDSPPLITASKAPE